MGPEPPSARRPEATSLVASPCGDPLHTSDQCHVLAAGHPNGAGSVDLSVPLLSVVGQLEAPPLCLPLQSGFSSWEQHRANQFLRMCKWLSFCLLIVFSVLRLALQLFLTEHGFHMAPPS